MGLFSGLGELVSFGLTGMTGFSGLTDMFGLTNNAATQANDANMYGLAASNAASNENRALQQQMFDYQKSLFDPFFKAGLPAYYQYIDAVTGQRQNYIDPTTGQAATSSAYQPQNSPAYQWQKSELDKNMNRQLSSRGRMNSTYGMQAIGNAYGNLGANEYDKGLTRLAGIADTARQGAGSLASSAGAYAQNQGNNILGQGDNTANALTSTGNMWTQNQQQVANNYLSLLKSGASLYGMGA